MFKDEKEIEKLFKAFDDYLKNTPREQIIKDLIEAAGGEERFNEIFEDIE